MLVAELEGLAQVDLPLWDRLVYFVVEEVEAEEARPVAPATAVPAAVELYLQEEAAEEERSPIPVPPALHLKLVEPVPRARVAGELAIQQVLGSPPVALV